MTESPTKDLLPYTTSLKVRISVYYSGAVGSIDTNIQSSAKAYNVNPVRAQIFVVIATLLSLMSRTVPGIEQILCNIF